MMQILTMMLLATGLSAPAFGSPGVTGIYDELTPAQQKAVQSGQQVVLTEEVAGSAWPKITAYQRVDGTAEEGAAVFSDFDHQMTYMPDMTKSKVVQRPDRSSAVVDYRMTIIIISVNYTLLNRVSAYNDGGAFRVDWKLVKGEKMKDVIGSAQFENLGTGSLVKYTSFIFPTSSSAASYRERAIRGVKVSMTALKNQIARERTSNQPLLERQKAALREAVR